MSAVADRSSIAAADASRIVLCAGETSGDQLGAELIQQLRARLPTAQFAGIGGPRMRAAGLEIWWDASELAVMGFAEVLRHLPRLLKLRRAFRQRALQCKPDAYIGIDAPDFNLGVERWLKQRGIRTLHYVSPSVWAWRQNRAATIGASADRVLCLFPMEPPIYAKHGVDAHFVGHPLADQIALDPDRAAARATLNLAFHAPVLAVLPGSRLSEITRMLPVFLQAALQARDRIAGLRILIPAANSQCRTAIEALLADADWPGQRPLLLDGQAQGAMIASDCVLLASGTAALEAMLCKRPMVVGHRIAPLTYRIVKGFGLLKTRHVSLPNILAGEELVPELLQGDCTASNLAASIIAWFSQPEAVAALRPRFRALHEALRCDASARAAEAIVDLLDNRV